MFVIASQTFSSSTIFKCARIFTFAVKSYKTTSDVKCYVDIFSDTSLGGKNVVMKMKSDYHKSTVNPVAFKCEIY